MENKLEHKVKYLRSEIIFLIRQYFRKNKFIEVETPLLVLSPGMEVHIRPLSIQDHKTYLHTSPEFSMKKILSKGADQIFQICKVFRNEPLSSTHTPEFTMLEWYRAGADYEDIMKDVESLFQYIAENIYQSQTFTTSTYGTQNLSSPWLKLTVNDAFKEFVGRPLTELLSLEAMVEFCSREGFVTNDMRSNCGQLGFWDDCFFLIMLNKIEPAIKHLNRPVILYEYPKSQAALANLKKDSNGHIWAKRFEIYAGGLEIGNAFDELTDANEQRARFQSDMNLRKSIYGDAFPPNPVDEDFLDCLRKLPKSAGIAVGVDRLVMYFAGAATIQEVLWEQPFFKKYME